MFRIAVTGPESAGKSWLCVQLARHYQTVFVPEYARSYLQELERDYRQDDLLEIAKGQLAAWEQACPGANELLICDTEFLVLKIWSLHKYNSCHSWIIEQLEKNPFDLYLLCDVDLPWEYDPQREHPRLRQYLFDWYRRELEDYGFPYQVVSGRGDDRLQNAISAIDKSLHAS